jgi:hypothetical protein
MRRFLIRNAAGEQVGEGVEWSDGSVAAKLDAARLPTNFLNTKDLSPSLAPHGFSIDWLDPEPGTLTDDTDTADGKCWYCQRSD